jgi:ribonuclease VapC
MPLYIKDETTTRLVNELARRRGLTKQRAVRLAVEAELAREERVVCLGTDPRRICSASSAWETVAGVARSYRFPAPAARARVHLFRDAMDFTFVGIGEPEFARGDCFADACARANGARLLFKADDFARTHIESAMG